MTLLLISLLGAVTFLLPLLGVGGIAPAGTAVVLALIAVTGVEVVARHLDSRRIALLATFVALDTVLRLMLVEGVAGFSPMFFLIVCAGYVWGPRFGFLTGALSLLVSALVTGGVGIWLPYEMFAAGWTGAGAGLLGVLAARGNHPPAWRRDLALLGGYGLVAGLLYGAAMDVWDWSFFGGAPGLGPDPGLPVAALMQRFARFYVSTSLGYDVVRGVGTAVMLALMGKPVITALRRVLLQSEVGIELIGNGRAEPAVRHGSGREESPIALADHPVDTTGWGHA